MRLLEQVPGSVLWLKQPGEKAKSNLLAAAKAAGIEQSRLIFASPQRWSSILRVTDWPICSSIPFHITPMPPAVTHFGRDCRF